MKALAVRLNRLRYPVIIILSSMIACGCADGELKKAIKAYRGDGKIQYLKAPLLGASGCAIQMPMFDLSRPVHVQYDFTGIPTGLGRYWIFLVVPEPCPLEDVRQGVYSLSVKQNDLTIRALSSSLKDIRNNVRGGKENRFHFYVDDNQRQSGITVGDSTSTWSVAVSYTNAILKEPTEAYILITRGGRK